MKNVIFYEYPTLYSDYQKYKPFYAEKGCPNLSGHPFSNFFEKINSDLLKKRLISYDRDGDVR